MNYEQTLQKCREIGFNQDITNETLWNTAYQLGRSRWWWGPSWMVNLVRRINTIQARFRLGKAFITALIIGFIMIAVMILTF